MAYPSIFDNAFERRISQSVTLRLKTLEGTVYGSAILNSAGVNSYASGNGLDKEFRVRKTYKVGVTGHFEPDHSQTNLYGPDGSKFGPFGRFRGQDSGWPDPDLAPGMRTQSIEYGMYSQRLVFPNFYEDAVADSDPTLMAKVAADETAAFATNVVMHYAQSFYTSGNTRFAYAAAIPGTAVSFATSAAADFGSAVANSILTIDLSSINQYALNKLEINMAVDLLNNSNGNLLNYVGGAARAVGRVINIDWVHGKVQVAFAATAACTGAVTSTVYAKNQLVDCRDFVSNIVATASGTWVVADLVPAFTVAAATGGSVAKAMPLGINDWFKTTGQLLANSGYQNGSEGNGIINVDKLGMFASYHENAGGATLSDSLMDRIVMRLLPQYDRFMPGARPDTAFTTYGVVQGYIEGKRAIADLVRTDGSLNLQREGAQNGIRFQTTSGVDMRIVADPFCDSGRLYMGMVGQGNWKIDVPPTVAGGSSGGPVPTPAGLPIHFAAKRSGHTSNVVPRYTVVNNGTRFTQDSYVPMECKMQLCPDKVPVGAVVSGLKETTGYGSTSNLNA